jgi:Spy/CpxP family protein refolding chaperone
MTLSNHKEITMSKFAQQALTAKHVYVAALLAASAAFAGAQTATAPTPPPAGEPGMQQGMGDHAKHDGMMKKMKEMRGAHMAKRQAELKAKLKITPEQEASWTSFTAAMAPPAMQRPDRAAVHAEMEKLTTPERIDKMQAMRAQHQATMKTHMDKRAEATKAFYSTLSADQKKVFDTETLKFAQHRHEAMHGGNKG